MKVDHAQSLRERSIVYGAKDEADVRMERSLKRGC